MPVILPPLRLRAHQIGVLPLAALPGRLAHQGSSPRVTVGKFTLLSLTNEAAKMAETSGEGLFPCRAPASWQPPCRALPLTRLNVMSY